MADHFRKEIRYGVGLDIGIASVGWAVVALDGADEPCGIVDLGSRIFEAAEVPKDGSSLAAPRRMKRGAGRRNRRHKHRIERIKYLIVQQGLLSQKQLEALYTPRQLEDVYALRARGLDMPLRPDEFARVLIHLAQRRGFKSNRKADASDQENGKLLQAVEENRVRMQEGGWRSVGEMFARDPFYGAHKRNKEGVYLSTVQRSMVEAEARLLFERQRAFGQTFADEKLEKEYIDILLSQRSFDEGPGGGSPYGGNQIEKMRGKCLFTGEPRVPKAAWSFEKFRFWQTVNNLRVYTLSSSRNLTADEKQLIFEEASKRSALKYQQVRKLLHLGDDERFSGLNYDAKKKRGKKSASGADTDALQEDAKAEDKVLIQFKAYYALRKALDAVEENRIEQLDENTLDGIAEALTCYKQEETTNGELEKLGLSQAEIDALSAVTAFSGFGHLSASACRRLLPHLQQGMSYDLACAAAGFDFQGHLKDRDFVLHGNAEELQDITNPVVRRAVAQTIKVLNGIIRQMEHSPVFVKVELAREMAKNHDERQELIKSMEQNAARNEQAVKRLKEEFHLMQPTGLDIMKFKLYEEQQGRCAYTLESFQLSRLFEKGYAEVDHIIPYSISFDDSYSNKVLVTAKANRDKGNRLPLEYLTGEARERFMVYTQSAPYRGNKKRHLLKQSITQEDERRFKERNLQDTKYMSRFLYNFINDHLQFEDFATQRRKHVTAVSGGITSHLRKRWGLSKFREDGDGHHAQDAVVIACATDGMIHSISKFYSHQEGEYEQDAVGTFSVHTLTGEQFPSPWPGFRHDVQLRMQALQPAERLADLRRRGLLPSYDDLPRQVIDSARPLFVSRMPKRSARGAAHMDTVKGLAKDGSGLLVRRVPLQSLQLKDGEIKDYYRPDDDPALYEVLKQRLIQADGDAKKAFEAPVYKPGSAAPVRRVKLCEKSSLYVPVHGGKGAAGNGSMVRLDVYYVEGDGYYGVPVYIADTVKDALPNRACVAHKTYDEWKVMDDSHFQFSLYPNDLMCIEDKAAIQLALTNKDSELPKERNALKGELLYYKGFDISSGKILGCSHDNAYMFGKGLKRLAKVEKHQVDVLGNVSKVNRERRMPFR